MLAHRFGAIKVMVDEEEIKYWHNAVKERKHHNLSHDIVAEISPASWKVDKPTVGMIHVPGLVHETSSLYMSDDLSKDVHEFVDKKYRPNGCENVYVTGGALFPLSGSWNREFFSPSLTWQFQNLC
jgi:hypothetical protein